jgi:hypothetical protein
MTKAKRKLSEISFQPYALVMKAFESQEFIEKIQQVRVTMELPDFLEKFFGIWGSDAQVLAKLMGYERDESDDVEAVSYEDWINERVEGIEILKSLKESENASMALVALDEKDILTVLKAQAKLEPFLNQPEGQTSGTQLEKNMPNPTIEMVEKSALVDLQKSFDEQKTALEKAASDLAEAKVELEKAGAKIAEFEAEKAKAKVDARKAALKDAVADDAKVEVLFKSLSLVSDEDFVATVETLKGLRAAQENTELFKETGASTGEQSSAVESPIQKALKAELAKQAK